MGYIGWFCGVWGSYIDSNIRFVSISNSVSTFLRLLPLPLPLPLPLSPPSVSLFVSFSLLFFLLLPPPSSLVDGSGGRRQRDGTYVRGLSGKVPGARDTGRRRYLVRGERVRER